MSLVFPSHVQGESETGTDVSDFRKFKGPVSGVENRVPAQQQRYPFFNVQLSGHLGFRVYGQKIFTRMVRPYSARLFDHLIQRLVCCFISLESQSRMKPGHRVQNRTTGPAADAVEPPQRTGGIQLQRLYARPCWPRFDGRPSENSPRLCLWTPFPA